MLDKITLIFDDYEVKMKRLKKAAYKQNMEAFCEEQRDIISEMLTLVGQAEDKDAKAIEIGQDFSKKIFDIFAKRGRVSGTKKSDLSLFMIYYVFPTILLTRNPNAELLCDKMRDTWNEQFKVNINYADFDTLCAGFRDKMFGLF